MLKSLIKHSSLLLAICGLTVVALPNEAVAQNVLVLESNDTTNSKGNQIANKTTGFTITSEGPTAFAARTDFSSFDVVFFACVFQNTARNAAKNNAAFQSVATGGRVVVTGIHADDHGEAGAGQFLQDAITWIADCPNTGVLALCDFPAINWDYLPFPGVTASSAGINPGDRDVRFIPPQHPIFANTTDGPGTFTLDNWQQTVHAVWNTLGAGNGGYEDDGFLAVAESRRTTSSGTFRVCALAADFCCEAGAEICDVDDDEITVLLPPGVAPGDVVGGRITMLDGVPVNIPAVAIDDDCDCDDNNGDDDESPCVELEFDDLPFDLDEAIEVCVELDLVDGSITCETCFVGDDDDDDDDD